MSEILVDNLTGKTAAGSIVVYGEGGTATTNLQQGLAKAWVNFDGTGTPAARDSLNLSTITDNAAGHYEFNFSNSMANATYTFSASAHGQTDHIYDGGVLNITTGFAELYYGTGGTPSVYANSRADAARYGGIVMGDLA